MTSTTGPCRIELSPNCALTPRSARLFLLSVATPTLAIATALALQGFWPVLPFAGAELALLSWATHASMRRGRDREVITVAEDCVALEICIAGQRQVAVFPRHWTRVKLHRPLQTLHPSRLAIESRGRVCEVGRFLTEDERHHLARRLTRLIGRMNESPALGTARDPLP